MASATSRSKRSLDLGTSGKSKVKSKVSAPRNPKLVKGAFKNDKKSPSAFMAEMSLSTQERLKATYEMHIPEIIELLDMSEMTLQKNTAVDLEGPLFQPYPSEIIFQNFEPHQVYRVPLQLRNNDQVGRLIKVVQEESPYFSIISPPDIGHKVAPGMDTIFFIQFMADQKTDYVHEIICITEREKFIIPVRAIGARGILDFPDEVHYGTCAVKYETCKTLLVRNIGNKQAKFSLRAEDAFSVTPEKGILEVGASMQVDVSFNSPVVGSCQSDLVIQYDTGKPINTQLGSIFVAFLCLSVDAMRLFLPNKEKMNEGFSAGQDSGNQSSGADLEYLQYLRADT